MKKVSLQLLVGLLCVASIFIGCSRSMSDVSVDDSADNTNEPLKIACLMSGPINDQGWNATAYQGLKLIEEEYGAEISYSESTEQSDMETAFRSYADEGYDIIFGHGFEFDDAGLKVAKDYPETTFVIIAGVSVDENLIPINVDNYEQGFIQGIVAGVITESNTIGYVGGMEIPPIQDSLKGFSAGAKFVNPNVEVKSTFIGNFEDTAKVKEIALAMIESGTDVLMSDAAQAGLGAIEAVKEKGALMIGSNSDQNSLAPNNIVTSGIDDLASCMKLVAGEIIDGTFESKSYVFGIKDGAVYLAPYHEFENKLSPEAIDQIDSIITDIMDGKLNPHDFME